MKGKIALLVGGAAGYVLGTRAGRERYEQIKQQANRAWHNPKVQEKAGQAQDFAKSQAPVLKDKAAGAASSATGAAKHAAQGASDKASSDTGSSDTAGPGTGPGTSSTDTSTNGGTAPYPTSATTGLN